MHLISGADADAAETRELVDDRRSIAAVVGLVMEILKLSDKYNVPGEQCSYF